MIASQIFRVIPKTRNFSLNFSEYIFRLTPMFNYCFGMFSMSNALFWQFVFELNALPGPWSKYGMIKEAITMPIMTVIYFILIFYIEMRRGTIKEEKVPVAAKKQLAIESQPLNAKLMTNDQEGLDDEDNNPENLEEEVLEEINEVKSRNDWAIKVESLKKEYMMIGEGN